MASTLAGCRRDRGRALSFRFQREHGPASSSSVLIHSDYSTLLMQKKLIRHVIPVMGAKSGLIVKNEMVYTTS